MQTQPARDLTRDKYHQARRDLHAAAIMDRLDTAALRRENETRDVGYRAHVGTDQAVRSVLYGLPADVAKLLSTRHVPASPCLLPGNARIAAKIGRSPPGGPFGNLTLNQRVALRAAFKQMDAANARRAAEQLAARLEIAA